MGLYDDARRAYEENQDEAEEAYKLFCDYCGGTPPPRVPGMDTRCRLAHRIAWRGLSIVEAAAREYVYRWGLAIKAPDQCGATGRIDQRDRRPQACVSIFGAPHTIGL